jgi:hypothetical protein
MNLLIELLNTPAFLSVLAGVGVNLEHVEREERPSSLLAELPADLVKVSKITATINGAPHVVLIVEEKGETSA